jgi:hypothetical protein
MELRLAGIGCQRNFLIQQGFLLDSPLIPLEEEVWHFFSQLRKIELSLGLELRPVL